MMREELLAQYRALREGCGLWQDPARSLLCLTGEDRHRFLNGLVTCEVQGLEPGRGVRGFFTDIKGHILAEVVVRAAADRLWLELPAETISSTAGHIEKYIVADRVEVDVPRNRESLTLVGPGSQAAVAPLLEGVSTAMSPWGQIEATRDGEEILLADDNRFGVPTLTLWAPAAGAEAWQAVLATAPAGCVEVGSEAVEILRVEEGAPRFGIDYDTENLPQETGLEGAVSYSKGCYLGQEVVARLHYRGHVARRVCRLRSAAETPPTVGSRLLLEGRETGVVTSAVISPLEGGVSALAMLQRRATAADTELQIESGGVLRVV